MILRMTDTPFRINAVIFCMVFLTSSLHILCIIMSSSSVCVTAVLCRERRNKRWNNCSLQGGRKEKSGRRAQLFTLRRTPEKGAKEGRRIERKIKRTDRDRDS